MNERRVTKVKNRFSWGLPIIIFLAAAGMCIYGAATGEAEAVLTKAVNICMECIGLG